MKWNIKELQEFLLIGSTLVEGSTLTEDESRLILAGKTILGHPISEARELLNYRDGIEWLMHELDASPFVSRDLILIFHQKLFLGFPGDHGRWKTTKNFTYRSHGDRFDYESPARVENAMLAWLQSYNETDDASQNIAKKTAALYYEFERIHPFEDGNGRIGRILIAYWLHWKHGQMFSFYLKDKPEHLKALEAANRGDLNALEDFFERRIEKETP